MTKHRRITGLVAIVLLAVATAATMRSHSPSTANSVGEISFNQRMADLDKLPADNFSDRFPAYLTNR